MLTALVALTFRLESGAVLYDVIGALFAVAAPLQSTAVVVPCRLHGDATACDRTGFGRTREVVDVYTVYYAPDVVQPKIAFLVAHLSHSFVLDGSGLQDNALVPLVVH